ncbi:MAG: metallophosphoesterase [Bacteroidales bacterium]
MKRNQMAIFFLIVLTVYFLTNFYLFLKGYRIFEPGSRERLLYTISFVLLASTFIAAKFLERSHSSVFTDVLNVIGGFWMGFMLYATLLFLLSDIIRPIGRLTGIIQPGSIPLYNTWTWYITVFISFLFIAGGFINAVIPVVKRYDISIEKDAGSIKEFRIAAVSDIHLGSIIRKRSVRKLSGMLNDLKPDAVFLLGDIVDGEIGPVLRGDLLKYFDIPRSTDGLLAITGNHEFIGGAARTIPYIESHGIRILKDEMVTLEGEIQIIGRIDRDGTRFKGGGRAPLDSLVALADKNKPIILLDHQPFNLADTEKNGIDLQLSGHTHHGQMWPLNYLTDMIYEVSYGYLRKGKSQIIVSSGYGLWGPRIRSGSRSEVLLINIRFTGAGRSD